MNELSPLIVRYLTQCGDVWEGIENLSSILVSWVKLTSINALRNYIHSELDKLKCEGKFSPYSDDEIDGWPKTKIWSTLVSWFQHELPSLRNVEYQSVQHQDSVQLTSANLIADMLVQQKVEDAFMILLEAANLWACVMADTHEDEITEDAIATKTFQEPWAKDELRMHVIYGLYWYLDGGSERAFADTAAGRLRQGRV